jgi:hypothetical protein
MAVKRFQRCVDVVERSQGVDSHWGGGDAEYKEFYSLVDQRTQLGTEIHEFAPINPQALFRAVSIAPARNRYFPKGAWNVTEIRFDLTKRFPALLDWDRSIAARWRTQHNMQRAGISAETLLTIMRPAVARRVVARRHLPQRRRAGGGVWTDSYPCRLATLQAASSKYRR